MGGGSRASEEALPEAKLVRGPASTAWFWPPTCRFSLRSSTSHDTLVRAHGHYLLIIDVHSSTRGPFTQTTSPKSEFRVSVLLFSRHFYFEVLRDRYFPAHVRNRARSHSWARRIMHGSPPGIYLDSRRSLAPQVFFMRNGFVLQEVERTFASSITKIKTRRGLPLL